MDRFIEIGHFASLPSFAHLKSNMDRFIVKKLYAAPATKCDI